MKENKDSLEKKVNEIKEIIYYETATVINRLIEVSNKALTDNVTEEEKIKLKETLEKVKEVKDSFRLMLFNKLDNILK